MRSEINRSAPGMRYLNLNELRMKLGCRGRTTVYRDVNQGRAPAPHSSRWPQLLARGRGRRRPSEAGGKARHEPAVMTGVIDVLDLTRALGGRWHGRYGLALCPAHDDGRTGALSVALSDSGRLLLHCFAGCSFAAIMASLRDRGFIEKSRPAADADGATWPRPLSRPHGDRSQLVEQLWRQSRPSAGTLVERYLRNRAISGELPDGVRFHPCCYHGPEGRRLLRWWQR